MATTTKAVSNQVETIISDHLQQFPEAASVGDVCRQGDVYIGRLACVPSSCRAIKNPIAQLAPGNTQGSRHCISNLKNVRMYDVADKTVYDGPVIEVIKPVTVTHPEHGDWKLPRGVYAVWYQRTEDSEGHQRRVRD